MAARSSARQLRLVVPDSDEIEKARDRGAREERQLVVRYLMALDDDDGYEYEPPLAIADRLLRGVHRCGRK